MSLRFYAGIGSRETPEAKLDMMLEIAADLAHHNFVLRSGGADGADKAFEAGCDWAAGKKQIFLPWTGFNGRQTSARFNSEQFGVFAGVDNAAMDLAAQHHPAWAVCNAGARKLHARNGYQVLGPSLNEPVAFVICWTPYGRGGGGTGQALRIARARGITIYDIGGRPCPSITELLEKHP